jgi:hypothetical protein
LFSGQAATVDLLEKARHAGYNFTTLTKPIHPTDMLNRINECLARETDLTPDPTSVEDESRSEAYSFS